MLEIESKLRLGLIDPTLSSRKYPRFKEYAEDWLERVCPVTHVPSYVKKCRQTLRDHLLPTLGSKRLDEITAREVTELRRGLMQRGYATQSIKNITATLSMIFTEAIRNGLATLNPTAGLERLKREQKEMLVWSAEERDRLLLHARERHPRLFQVVAFAVFTGLRPMELRGLLRDALDFEACEVRVHRQWCSKQNKFVPYTKGKAARTVPVPPEIMALLADKQGLGMGDQVFPEIINSFGHRYLKPLMRSAGVREIRFHDLRHTFASILYDRTKDLLLVKDLLGHKSIATTQAYVHKLTNRHKGATNVLVTGASFLNTPAKVINLADARN